MLKGFVSLVTGGASGLGKATVDRLVRNGGKVVLLDIQATRAHEFAKTLGDNVIVSPGCITSEEDVQKCLDLTKERFGRLDCVVNCAGRSVAHQTYNFYNKKAHELKDFTELVNVNTVGTFNVIRLSAALLAENTPNSDGQKGVIVNTASTIAYEGDIGQAAYAASTAGIIGMTLPIARDLAPLGIRVVTIAPVETMGPWSGDAVAFSREVGAKLRSVSGDPLSKEHFVQRISLAIQRGNAASVLGIFDTPLIAYIPDKIKEFLKRTVPFPSRLGKPEEFAHLVTSVIENPMLNGEVIRLDGAHRWFPL